MNTNSIDAFKKLHAAEYQKRFIEQNVRADGRTLNEFRATTVTCGESATTRRDRQQCCWSVSHESAALQTRWPTASALR